MGTVNVEAVVTLYTVTGFTQIRIRLCFLATIPSTSRDERIYHVYVWEKIFIPSSLSLNCQVFR